MTAEKYDGDVTGVTMITFFVASGGAIYAGVTYDGFKAAIFAFVGLIILYPISIRIFRSIFELLWSWAYPGSVEAKVLSFMWACFWPLTAIPICFYLLLRGLVRNLM